MGRRGPQPEPTNLRVFKGNPGKRPINTQEPRLEAPDPVAEAPERLKGVAAEEWKANYEELVASGVLRRADVKHFEDYCFVYGELRTFEGLAEQVGVEAAIRLGYQSQKAKLRADVLKYRDRLGLNPSARSGVRPVEAKPESKINKFISKG